MTVWLNNIPGGCGVDFGVHSKDLNLTIARRLPSHCSVYQTDIRGIMVSNEYASVKKHYLLFFQALRNIIEYMGFQLFRGATCSGWYNHWSAHDLYIILNFIQICQSTHIVTSPSGTWFKYTIFLSGMENGATNGRDSNGFKFLTFVQPIANHVNMCGKYQKGFDKLLNFYHTI